MTISKNRRH